MKLKLALILALAAVGIHGYLALHYYDLNFGMSSGDSLCNISSTFNCDTVAASQYSSFLQMPIALWGATANLILALLIAVWWLGWTENSTRLGRYTFWFAGLIAAASIIMGGISLFLISSYCIFCIILYALSFTTWLLLYHSQESHTVPTSVHLRELIGPARGYLIYILAIPLLTFFIHKSYVMRVGAQQLGQVVRSSLLEWKAGPAYELGATTPSLKKGAPDAKMVIAEFADFLCGHCKNASPTLKAFIDSHPKAALHFYSFPLDGTCNSTIPGGDGRSCWIAKNVYCAEQIAQKGWESHDLFFSKQEKFLAERTLESLQKESQNISLQLGLSESEMALCIQSPETAEAIQSQAKLGDAAGVRGTPALYVNGKKLSRGQLLPVLEAVYRDLTK